MAMAMEPARCNEVHHRSDLDALACCPGTLTGTASCRPFTSHPLDQAGAPCPDRGSTGQRLCPRLLYTARSRSTHGIAAAPFPRQVSSGCLASQMQVRDILPVNLHVHRSVPSTGVGYPQLATRVGDRQLAKSNR